MASKLDDFLKKASPEQRNAIRSQGQNLENNTQKIVEVHETPTTSTPVASKQVDSSAKKLDERIGEHIQNVNDGQGNNYLNKKDNLSQYPVSKDDKPKEKEQDKDLER